MENGKAKEVGVEKSKLKIEKEDFFYLNQIVNFQNKIFALGKDHIHLIASNLKKVDCIIEDGDFPDSY